LSAFTSDLQGVFIAQKLPRPQPCALRAISHGLLNISLTEFAYYVNEFPTSCAINVMEGCNFGWFKRRQGAIWGEGCRLKILYNYLKKHENVGDCESTEADRKFLLA
jgi:hypothetical protein